MSNIVLNNFYSVAPMMGKTDAFFCYLLSLINKDITVYSEMMHSEFINRTNILDTYDILKTKQKVVIQIAGSNPLSLAKASTISSLVGSLPSSSVKPSSNAPQ